MNSDFERFGANGREALRRRRKGEAGGKAGDTWSTAAL